MTTKGPTKWPDNCSYCGCPNMNTRLLDGEVITEWAYETVDIRLEELRRERAVISALVELHPDLKTEIEFLHRRYNPNRGLIAKWGEDTAAPWCYNDYGDER